MSAFSNVLIATDLSDKAAIAIEAGSQFACMQDAAVTLLHAIPPQPIAPEMNLPVGAWSGSDVTARIKDHALKVLNESAASLPKQLGKVETAAVSWNDPAGGICRYADNHNIDLIVVGTHGRTGLAALLIGSVAERVVRHASCSVLVVRGPLEPPASVLVATDLSAHAARGAEIATTLHGPLRSTTTLAHVHLPPSALSFAGHLYAAEKDIEAELNNELASVISTRFENAAHVSARLLVDSHPANCLCRYAADHRTDLLIATAHGHSALERMFIGSVSERITRHAPCSVLIVR